MGRSSRIRGRISIIFNQLIIQNNNLEQYILTKYGYVSNKEKIVQDQARKDQMIEILGLNSAVGRLGHDAKDEFGNKFELKSSTKNDFSTGRVVSIKMINIWRERYWIFATGENYQDGFKIKSLYFCSPEMMKEKFDVMETKFKPDIEILETVVKHMKQIINKTHLERMIYLMNRGMTYNNPKIGMPYIKKHSIKIDMKNHQKT